MKRIRDDKRFVQRWRKRTKTKLVDAFGDICCLCGETFELELYDFHHIVPENKKFKLSTGNCISWDTIKEEAKKCVMLCSNCHRKVEYGYSKVPENSLKFDENKIRLTVEKEVLPIYSNNPCPICGKQVLYRKTYCSQLCSQKSRRKVKDRPSKDELLKIVCVEGLEGTGRLFGVTGNSIRKWLKK